MLRRTFVTFLTVALIAALPGMGVVYAQSGGSSSEGPMPYLGVRVHDEADGAQVYMVLPGSPADEADLTIGDVITAVNDEVVDEEHTLFDRIRAYEPGDTVTLTVLRDGETLTVEITLVAVPGKSLRALVGESRLARLLETNPEIGRAIKHLRGLLGDHWLRWRQLFRELPFGRRVREIGAPASDAALQLNAGDQAGKSNWLARTVEEINEAVSLLKAKGNQTKAAQGTALAPHVFHEELPAWLADIVDALTGAANSARVSG